jgi:hypothetical protein
MASEQPQRLPINGNITAGLTRHSLRVAGGDPQKALEIYNRRLREAGVVPEDDPYVYPLDPYILNMYLTWQKQQEESQKAAAQQPATVTDKESAAAGAPPKATRKQKAPGKEAETAAPKEKKAATSEKAPQEAKETAVEPPAKETPIQQQGTEAKASGIAEEPEQDDILNEVREKARARKQQGGEEKPALRVESGKTEPGETFEVRDSGAKIAQERFERIGEFGRQRIEEERERQRQATPPPPEAPQPEEQPEAPPAASQQAQPPARPAEPPPAPPPAPPEEIPAERKEEPQGAPRPDAGAGALSVSAEEAQKTKLHPSFGTGED